MNRTLMPFLLLCLFLIGFACSSEQSKQLPKNQEVAPKAEVPNGLEYVNCLVGTKGKNETEYGGTWPIVSPPFAMTNWTPMTRFNAIGTAPYHYDDSLFKGILASHQPAIWMGDYGQLSLFPFTEGQAFDFEERGLPFAHEQESCSPHGYRLTLGDYQIEMSATAHCGMVEIGFTKGMPRLALDISRQKGFKGTFRLDSSGTKAYITNADRFSAGLSNKQLPNFKGCYVVRFSVPMEEVETFGQQPERYGVVLKPKTELPTGKLSLRVGSSFISLEQAEANLQAEVGGKTQQNIAMETKKAWETELNRFQAFGKNKDDLAIFYTALYRTLLLPRDISEQGKYYSAFDDQIHQGKSYNDFSLWDTYRAQHPLLVLMQPERSKDMVNALVEMYKQGGWLPKWPNPTYTNIMIGTHADAVLADAALKGVFPDDLESLWGGVWKNATHPPKNDRNTHWKDRLPNADYEGRAGLTWYQELGYVPSDKQYESVSRTLEFCYDDFCVMQIAGILGRGGDARELSKRTSNHLQLYDPEIGRYSPRLTNGEWDMSREAQYSERWDRYKANGFTEGHPLTYQFAAVHDLDIVEKMLGGKEAFEKNLDMIFDKGYYRHDNEPGHHYAYLYNYTHHFAKTQGRIRQIIDRNYQNSPDGLSGNEDCGQMSAWLVFSAMGFYPVCPGKPEYSLGYPLFDSLKVQLPNGKELKVLRLTPNDSSDWAVPRWNGQHLEENFIQHSRLKKGGVLTFK